MTQAAGQWARRIDPADVRELMTETNDGIIAVAGLALGLAGAEIGPFSAQLIVLISSVAGALSVFGVKLGEAMADREAHLAIAAEERRLMERSPDEEMAELADWFTGRGVSPQTARQVARELSAGDGLSAQLQLEYGIEQVTTRRSAWGAALRAGAAFLIGSLGPVLATLFVTSRWRTGYTLITAVLALTITSALLSALGRARFWSTTLRTLGIGLATLAGTFALGQLLA